MTSSVPLVLLHGALGAASQYADLVAALGADRPVVAFDLPGHGAAADAPYDLAAFGDVIAGAVDRPADVFGYSMGGYVALLLAHRRPDRVRRVCTLATKLAWTPEVAGREAARLDAERLAAKAPAFVATLAARHPGPGWRAVLGRTAALLRELGVAPLVTADLLREIDVPVRIAVGDRDEMVTVDECRAACRALPHGELVVLPGVPHPLEQVPTVTLATLIRDAFPHVTN